ncbi:hypothetical protein GCM10029976_014470 [Kribbella albertanoniae]|uniref:Uncharacterized protein n=1 Tax=Kribbella albertanoniae TaxID=1266829 RepID=A0A4R4PP28_9ACTN|nr:hypothetical protein [Kribbella albertanoniae]TDC23952.1 hypothetical protein E1261_27270 [Kribbella albertanoniae]
MSNSSRAISPTADQNAPDPLCRRPIGSERYVLGEEYFSTERYSYSHSWNENITLTKRPYTMSDLLNEFSAAGLWIETTLEPQLTEQARRRHPHKQEWMNKHLGILIFKLRPL